MYLSNHTQVLVLVDILSLLAPIMISFVSASHGLFVPAACQYADSQCISVQDCLLIWRLRGSVAAARHCCSSKRCRETRFWLQINGKARCDSHTRVLILHPQRFPMSETHVNAWDIHAQLHTHIRTHSHTSLIVYSVTFLGLVAFGRDCVWVTGSAVQPRCEPAETYNSNSGHIHPISSCKNKVLNLEVHQQNLVFIGRVFMHRSVILQNNLKGPECFTFSYLYKMC